MYTKNQFNHLMKTRKHWTGKQVGRIILQTSIEDLNGKTPIVDNQEFAPIINNFNDREDLIEYTMYANMASGIISAWNFVNAVGNEAVANLTYINSIISQIIDYSNAEERNRLSPVIISPEQYEKYKESYAKVKAVNDEKVKNRKITLGELLTDTSATTKENGTKEYGPNTSKVMEKYRKTFFSNSDINYLRTFVHSSKHPVKHDNYNDEQLLKGFNDIAEAINPLNRLVRKKYPELYSIDRTTEAFLSAHYTPNSLKGKDADHEKRLDKVMENYVHIVRNEQLKIMYAQDITFKEALLKAIEAYPFELPTKSLFNRVNTVPFIPDKLSYADLLFDNEETVNIALAFWNYSYLEHDKDNPEYNEFIRSHFKDFIKASKKDLIQKYPKMSNILDEATNSTSFIIPQFTYETLATAGVKLFEDIIEDATEDETRFYEMFPENQQEQVERAGYAVFHSNPRIPVPKKYLSKLQKDFLSEMQHYDIENLIPYVLKSNEDKLKKAFHAIKYYTKVQTTYEDYFKGISRVADDIKIRKYNKTTAYDEFTKSVQSYYKNLYTLLQLIDKVIDDKESKITAINTVKKHLPMVKTTYPNYKHKTIKEIASLLIQSYQSSIPTGVMFIFNMIGEGAD